MQVKSIANIVFLFSCPVIFAPAIEAQSEKPQATVFYSFEFEDISNPELLKKKPAEFLARLSKEPKTTRDFMNIAENSKLARFC